MPKQQSLSTRSPSQKEKPRKAILRTADLLKQNGRDKGKGKEKDKAVWGELNELIHGAKDLPGALQVERFAELRALEILAFQNAIKSAASHGNSRIFQSLPRHLRRRAASHNPRRVPKRMRNKAAAEIDPGDKTVKIHRKKAKLRARGNLRGESRTEQLLKRQRNKSWLSTHIWHAKRFHMTNLWSYRLPLTPTLKSFRPAYRASRKKAIVHDTSYFGIIELEGSRAKLLKALGRITGGRRFAGAKYESGGRMAKTMLYSYDLYPHGLIGPVEILWQPDEEMNGDRTLWIRIHPSIFQECWDALKSVLKRCSTVPPDDAGPSNQLALESAIHMRDLRGEVDAFEIMGPLAGRVLRRVLRVCKDEEHCKHQFFESLGTDPAQVAEGLIVGLKVYDPRLHFPPSVLPEPVVDASDGVLRSAVQFPPTAELARSSLWSSDIRDALFIPTYKKSDLDHRRHELGMPGTKLRPTTQDDRVPLLVIQRTLRSASAEYESMHGFTLLLPRGWSMYLLQSIVYTGTLVGGLTERRTQHREAGVACFPEHIGAVCKAGEEYAKMKAIMEESRWARKPPAKRSEWRSLGTRYPFFPHWQDVMKDHGTTEEERLLNEAPVESFRPWLVLLPIIDRMSLITRSRGPSDQLLAIINAFRLQRSMRPLQPTSASEMYRSALLNVQVEMLGRGSPGDMAVIYMISAEERKDWIHAHELDVNLGRAGYLDPAIGDFPVSEIQKLGEIRTKEEATIGNVTTGNFSLSRGRGHGLATVTLSGFVELVRIANDGKEGDKHLVLVKVRDRDGHLCRLASLSII